MNRKYQESVSYPYLNFCFLQLETCCLLIWSSSASLQLNKYSIPPPSHERANQTLVNCFIRATHFLGKVSTTQPIQLFIEQDYTVAP